MWQVKTDAQVLYLKSDGDSNIFQENKYACKIFWKNIILNVRIAS